MVTKFKRNEKIITGRLSDDLVMMDINMGKYFSLNQVATTIWDLLENPITIDDICEKLTSEFEVSKEQCKKEVEEYMKEMQKLKMIEID